MRMTRDAVLHTPSNFRSTQQQQRIQRYDHQFAASTLQDFSDLNLRVQLNTFLLSSTDEPVPTSDHEDVTASSTWDVANLSPSQRRLFVSDRVVRVLGEDSKPVIKLEKSGLVSLAGIQLPKSYDSSGTCRSYTTANAKVQQLLPPKSKVQVRVLASDQAVQKAVLIAESPKVDNGAPSSKTIQGELVRRGFAKVSNNPLSEQDFPGLLNYLQYLEHEAIQQHMGPLHRSCDNEKDDASFVTEGAQFEPMEFTMQTEWKSDGGRPVRRANPDLAQKTRPKNPGDSKGCSDFDTYEDALKWYEFYFSWYGDVARLDRNNDGIPCPGLPHTKDMDRYRMKIATKTI